MDGEGDRQGECATDECLPAGRQMRELRGAGKSAGSIISKAQVAMDGRGWPSRVLWATVRYGFPVAMIAGALVLHWTLTAWVGPGLPTFILFYPAVTVVALLAGFRSGLAATALTLIVVEIWVLAPVGSLHVVSPVDRLALAIFAFNGSLICAVAGLYRRNRDKMAAYERELAMRESREAFVELVERSPFGTYVVDSRFRVAMMNTATQKGAFRNVRPVVGRDFEEVMRILWPEPVAAEIIGHFRHTLDTGEAYYSPRFTNPRHDAEIVESYEWELHRMTLPDGQQGVICYYYDSTRLRQAEEKLRGSEERFRLLVEQTADGIFVADSGGRYTDVNPAGAAMFGYTREEMLRLNLPDVLMAEEIPRLSSQIAELNSGTITQNQWRFRRKDGSEFHGEVVGRQLPGGGYQGVLRDITARKQVEEDLKKLNRTLRALSNSNQAVMRATDEVAFVREVCEIVVRDCGHRMVWVGYARDDEAKTVAPVAWAGHDAGYVQTTRITWADTERGRGPSGTCIRTGTPFVCNNFATDPRFAPWREEAAKRGYASSISLPLLAEGKAFGAMMIYSEQLAPFSEEEVRLLAELGDDLAHGITMLRLRTAHAKAAEALANAKQAAETANKAKDQFIAVLSHELRTPLTPAAAALSFLCKDIRLPHDVREDLEMVNNNIALEVRLIADLLDVSRIISGKLHLEKRAIDVAEVIREAANIVSGDMDAKGQTLAIETPDEPYMAFGDAARLQQVFWNLLRNSIKFSPERSRITICARRETQGGGREVKQDGGLAGGGKLVVEVTDHGSGIAAEALPRLFNAFEQEEKSRAFGGLGLGLSICKAVVEMHSGSITASSDGAGCGARFTVELPLMGRGPAPVGMQSPARAMLSAARKAQKGRTLRILLVEDHADTAKLMKRLLISQGYEVTTAGAVASGLEALAKQKPDLLITDLGLPDGSGHDLLRSLRGQGHDIPAIALSGYGTPADMASTKAAGFAEHLVKPISGIEVVTAAIGRLEL